MLKKIELVDPGMLQTNYFDNKKQLSACAITIGMYWAGYRDI